MLAAATVCPHPPFLVPQVSVAEPAWLERLRHESLAAVRRLTLSGVEQIVAVGSGEQTQTHGASAGGSLHRYGVEVSVGGSDVVLPLSLTIAAWLIDQSGWQGPRTYVSIDSAAAAAECAKVGADLTAGEGAVGLLVMGDGSAKRSTEAPGYFDERSTGFDAGVVDALDGFDVERLMALSPAAATELWAAGRPAWQCLAGAVSNAQPGLTARVPYDDAPRGVGYFVVEWALA